MVKVAVVAAERPSLGLVVNGTVRTVAQTAAAAAALSKGSVDGAGGRHSAPLCARLLESESDSGSHTQPAAQANEDHQPIASGDGHRTLGPDTWRGRGGLREQVTMAAVDPEEQRSRSEVSSEWEVPRDS